MFSDQVLLCLFPFLSWVQITRQKRKTYFHFSVFASQQKLFLTFLPVQCHSYDLIHLICSSYVLSQCIFNIEIIFDIGEISTLFCLHCINLKQKCQLLVQKLNPVPNFYLSFSYKCSHKVDSGKFVIPMCSRICFYKN